MQPLSSPLAASGWLLLKRGPPDPCSPSAQSTIPGPLPAHPPRITPLHVLSPEIGASSHETMKVGLPLPYLPRRSPHLGPMASTERKWAWGQTLPAYPQISSSQLALQACLRPGAPITSAGSWGQTHHLWLHAATRDPFRVQQPSEPCFPILTLCPLNKHTQGPEGSCLTTVRTTGHPQGKDSKANFSSVPSGPREPQEKKREAGRKKEEGDGGGAQKDIDQKKKKSNFGKPRSSE